MFEQPTTSFQCSQNQRLVPVKSLIGNLWELSGRNHVLCVFSFSEVGTFIEDYCSEGEFFVLFPAAETLGNLVVSYRFKSI